MGCFKKTFVRAIPKNAERVGDKVIIKLSNGRKVEREVNAAGKMRDKSTVYYGKVKQIDGTVKVVKLYEDKRASEAKLQDLRREASRGEAGYGSDFDASKSLEELIEVFISLKDRVCSAKTSVSNAEREIKTILNELGYKTLGHLVNPETPSRVESILTKWRKSTRGIVLPDQDSFTTNEMVHILETNPSTFRKTMMRFDIKPWVDGCHRRISKESAQVLIDNANKPISYSTLNRYAKRINEFFSYLYENKFIKQLPRKVATFSEGVRQDGIVRKRRRAVSWEVCKELCASVRESNIDRGGGISAFERSVLYMAAFCTTARRRSLEELEVRDCHLYGPTPYIHIRPETDKCGIERTIPITYQPLLEDLRTLISSKKKGDRVFRCPIDICNLLRRDIKHAKIPYRTEDGEFDFHAFRHSGTTHLCLQNVCVFKICKIAGWADVKMFMKRYGHLTTKDLSQVLNGVF